MFIQGEVTYLGCRVNKERIQPFWRKVDFIKNVSPPQNVSKLKSFLGLINIPFNVR